MNSYLCLYDEGLLGERAFVVTEAEKQGSQFWGSPTCTWPQNQESWHWGCDLVGSALV